MADDEKVEELRREVADALAHTPTADLTSAYLANWRPPSFSWVDDPEYRARFEESMRQWEEARRQTLAGQADRLAEATNELLRLMVEPFRPVLDEIGRQMRDFIEVMADYADEVIAYFERSRSEGE